MLTNNRQAAAFKEQLKKEERTRAQWSATHGATVQSFAQPDGTTPYVHLGTGGGSVPPMMAWAHDPVKPSAPMHPLVRHHSVVEDRHRVDPTSLPAAGIRTGITPKSGTQPPPSSQPIYDPALRIADTRQLDDGLVAPAQPRHYRPLVPVAGVSLAESDREADLRARRAGAPRRVVAAGRRVPMRRRPNATRTQQVSAPAAYYATPAQAYEDHYYDPPQQRYIPQVRHREVWVKKQPTADMNPQIQEIWLKKVVPEPYAEQVAVTRRQAPYQGGGARYVEADDDDLVVEEYDVEAQPRRRYEYVDDTDDASIVAVEEVQPRRVARAMPSGIPRGSVRLARRVDDQLYDARPVRVTPVRRSVAAAPVYEVDDGSTLLARTIKRPPLHRTPSEASAAAASIATGAGPVAPEPAAATLAKPRGKQADILSAIDPTKLGMKLRLASAQLPGGGVAVWSVAAKSIALEGGAKPGDVITHVNNKPVKSLPEFKTLVAASDGPLLLGVIRRGFGKMSLYLHRPFR